MVGCVWVISGVLLLIYIFDWFVLFIISFHMCLFFIIKYYKALLHFQNIIITLNCGLNKKKS